MINITFDLETLGKTSKAPIVQIAAVKFSNDGKILDSFISTIDINDLDNYDFNVCYSTIDWWLSQDRLAIDSVYNAKDTVLLVTAIKDFIEWIGDFNEYTYWSHATFDPPILTNTMNEIGIKDPIPFRNHRDIRTLTHITGFPDIKRVGISHNALDDCLYQADFISRCFKLLKE